MNKHQSQQQAPSTAEMKYSCSIDFPRHAPGRGIHDIVGHNHTYTLPHQTSGAGATPRSQTRDKKMSKKAEEEHLSRDEKRARALNVSLHTLIQSEMKVRKSFCLFPFFGECSFF